MNLKKNTRNGRVARRRAAERQTARKRNSRLRRERQRRDADVLADLAFQQHNWEQVYHLPDDWRETLRPFCLKAPLLLDPAFGQALEYIEGKSRHWLNSLEAWQPRGNTPENQLISLIEHLLVRYPIPRFFYEPFTAGEDALRLHRDMFLHLTRGGSLVKFVKRTRYPVPLTKRMCHEFLTSKHTRIWTALRTAQVKGHGGEETLGPALSYLWIGGSVCCQRHEEQRDRAIKWLCRQPDFPVDELGLFSAWVRHMANFNWQGRTASSVLRRAREWEADQRRRQAVALEQLLRSQGLYEQEMEKPFPASGLQPLGRNDWSIVKIRTPLELVEEGETMSHCVASYVNQAMAGECSFWSFRRVGTRFLTIQVKHGAIVQARGKHNRRTDAHEWNILRLWAKLNQLRIKR